jgi:hypothetical protein
VLLIYFCISSSLFGLKQESDTCRGSVFHADFFKALLNHDAQFFCSTDRSLSSSQKGFDPTLKQTRFVLSFRLYLRLYFTLFIWKVKSSYGGGLNLKYLYANGRFNLA